MTKHFGKLQLQPLLAVIRFNQFKPLLNIILQLLLSRLTFFLFRSICPF